MLVIPLSTDSGIVLDMTELGINSGGNWETSSGVFCTPAAWCNLLVGSGGFGLGFCACFGLNPLQCLILTRAAFFVHIRGESWDLKAANSLQHLTGTLVLQGATFGVMAEELLGGNQQQQGLL